MNSGVIAAIMTAIGAVIISVISSIQARTAQRDKFEQDRLSMAQAQTDVIMNRLASENTQLWAEVRSLRLENSDLRKRLRSAGID